jgi:hypothetical protein
MKTQPPSEVDWIRRHALNPAGRLPDNPADALVILDLCSGACRLVPASRRARAPEGPGGDAPGGAGL